MNIKIKKTFIGIVVLFLIIAPNLVSATNILERGHEGAQGLATKVGLNDSGDETNIYIIIGDWINTILGLLGVVFLVLLIYAGFMYATAGGNADQVKKARGGIINAVIGMLIVAIAYTVTNFVFDNLLNSIG